MASEEGTVPVVSTMVAKCSQQNAQALIQESVQQPQQHFVRFEDTHACNGGDGAAGPWRPEGLTAQTLDSTQLAQPPVQQVFSFSDNSGLPRDNSWRARYQEIHQELNRRTESSYLNQAGAVELAMRALSSGPLDSDRRLSNTHTSHTGSP